MKNSLYSILGIEEDAAKEEVKKAYRKLSKEHHPDKGGNEEEFNKVKEAYEVLFNEERRRRYDETGSYEEEVDSFTRDLIDFISNIMIRMIEERNSVQFDLMRDVERAIFNLKRLANRKIEEVSGKWELYNAALEKISRKDEGKNLVGELLNGKLKMAEATKDRLKAELEMLDKVEEELSNYNWECEKPIALIKDHSEIIKSIKELKDSVIENWEESFEKSKG